MSPRRLPRSGMSKNWRRVAAALTTATVALCVSGMTTAPAQSAPDADCPAPYTGDLNQDLAQNPDLTVTAKTVVTGTSPTEFTGHPLGVLKDGIAPGLDMILVDFGSTDGTTSQIDKAGIWEGMSGSPVYTSDGRLLGAVAYSLAAGISTIAGVTPATEMEKMLTAVPGSTSTAAARTVPVPARLARRIASSGAATPAQVDSGLKQLQLPFGISGVDLGQRRQQLAKGLGLRNARPMAAGSTGTEDPQIPVVAGGNVAASISYGEITAAGLGTATAVCGDEILAFGHPMNFTGASTMTMHGARALGVQPDATWASFKLANLGAPIGTVDQDHLSGLHGVVGATPATSLVTSSVTVGDSSRTGTTYVSVPSAVPDIALANVVTDQDRVFDAIGGGSGSFSWTIRLTQKDGTPFVIHRADEFADPGDLSYATVMDLANMLYTLQYGDLGVKRIDSVETSSNLSHDEVRYTIKKVQLRRHHAWHTLNRDRVLALRAGSTARLQVVLSSPDAGQKLVRTDLKVPAGAGHRTALLQVTGGNAAADQAQEVDVFDSGDPAVADSSAQPTLDDVVQQLRSTPHHDDVITELTWLARKSGRPTSHRRTRVRADHVVDGGLTFQVVGVPSHR